MAVYIIKYRATSSGGLPKAEVGTKMRPHVARGE
jgi:hypothetical protein